MSGLHAGPVGAQASGVAHQSEASSHNHGHGLDVGGDVSDDSDPIGDAEADEGHHHCPSAAAPVLPQAEVATTFAKQLLFASETSLLRLGAQAPPLDPPRA